MNIKNKQNKTSLETRAASSSGWSEKITGRTTNWWCRQTCETQQRAGTALCVTELVGFLPCCCPSAVFWGSGAALCPRCRQPRPPPRGAGGAGFGAVRMSAAVTSSERKGCRLMYVSHCLRKALPPHCFECLGGSGSGSLSRAIPTLSPAALVWKRRSAFPSLFPPPLRPDLEQPQLFLQHSAYSLRHLV